MVQSEDLRNSESSETDKGGDEETQSTSSIRTETDEDSDFYGNDGLRQRYEQKAREDTSGDYWHIHDWNIQVIAARAVERDPALWSRSRKRKRENDGSLGHSKTEKKSKNTPKNEEKDPSTPGPPPNIKSSPQKPYNPYEGQETALQLEESVTSFLTRLPPSSATTQTPWIYCANFDTGERPTTPNIASFKQAGTRLLDTFLAKRATLESSFDPPKTEGAITRMMSDDRALLESDILATAKVHNLTNGKWMLFPTKDKVDRYWDAVVRGTVDGRLGTAAKVATRPDKPDDPTQVICVYTHDMSDEADVKRVLIELVRLKLAAGVVDRGFKMRGGIKGQIWYKPDYYTYLDITSGNEYKIKPTLYGTASLLTVTDLQGLH